METTFEVDTQYSEVPESELSDMEVAWVMGG